MKKQTKLGLVLAAAAVISVSVASLVSARGWVQNGADWYYVDNNGEYVTDTIQSSGNAKFYLGEDGAMMRDYFLEEYGDSNNAYYFGQNGAMVTNTWVAIESSRVENQEDYIPDNYWYYFQASGKAMKAAAGQIKKTTIDGKKYAFNEHGQMLTGWIDDNGKVINPDDDTNPFSTATYYAGGDNDGVLRSGWVTYYDGYDGDNYAAEYTNLYFYFNTSNNKKYGVDGATTKKINGKTYAFNSEGIMLSGWDYWEEIQGHPSADVRYFSGEDDGHQVKKGWVYAVPAYEIDSKKYNDDEEQYMYFNAAGNIVKDQFKKINGKFYVFNTTGIMKSGVILWAADNAEGSRYINKLDLDYAEGADVAKKGILTTGNGEYIKVNKDGVVTAMSTGYDTNPVPVVGTTKIKLHLYGSDGARKTGANTVEFADDNYTLQTQGNMGDKGSGAFNKKYYSLGIQLKASADIRYGIYTLSSPSTLQPQNAVWTTGLNDSAETGNHYLVLTTGGAKLKGNQNGKKDADGNYWLVDKTGDYLRGIWTVNVSNQRKFSKGYTTKKINYVAAAASSYSTAELCSEFGLGESAAVDSRIADVKAWVPKDNGTTTTAATLRWFALNQDLTCDAFQSDYDGGSNKWIVAGFYDDARKTATLEYAATRTIDAAKAYEVTPTNDYFLNCYWAD